jgi:phenylalanine-4-hydroxylase
MDLERIPGHLRQFVVRQDYAQYSAEDQAVWRFVVLNTHRRLLETAHASYASGFTAAGISVAAIPRIEQMSEQLSRFGWHAVAVDGFIPARAFQAFQARGILPIAADIRTSEHLTYTPAPDIIHEAAGHAPFLAEPHFRQYLQQSGAIAEKAFSSPADRLVYEAIHALSEVKENPASTPEHVALAERRLVEAQQALGAPSESARLARLYWWTAEYGLVGTLGDYRLYGAGLLSSIGEGHFCRDPKVRKLPLSADCVEVDYDITRAQPQLFVVESFADLPEVLDDVAKTLAHRVGGERALQAAQDSEEIATLELDTGVELVGVISAFEPSLVEFSGPCAVARGGKLEPGLPRLSGYLLPLGALEDGRPLCQLDSEALRQRTGPDGRLVLRLHSELEIRGRVERPLMAEQRALLLVFDELEIWRGSSRLFCASGPYPLALGQRVRTVAAGAPPEFYVVTPFSRSMVPKARLFDATQRERIELHERALEAWRSLLGSEVASEFEKIAQRLDAAYPNEWLLRWNLLESLVKLGHDAREPGTLAHRLQTDLGRLEVRFQHLEPIATGLRYVRSLSGASSPQREHVG